MNTYDLTVGSWTRVGTWGSGLTCCHHFIAPDFWRKEGVSLTDSGFSTLLA